MLPTCQTRCSEITSEPTFGKCTLCPNVLAPSWMRLSCNGTKVVYNTQNVTLENYNLMVGEALKVLPY